MTAPAQKKTRRGMAGCNGGLARTFARRLSHVAACWASAALGALAGVGLIVTVEALLRAAGVTP